MIVTLVVIMIGISVVITIVIIIIALFTITTTIIVTINLFSVTTSSNLNASVLQQKAVSPGVSATTVYETRKQRAEFVGRVGLPVCFLLFNLAYWPTYLSSSLHPFE